MSLKREELINEVLKQKELEDTLLRTKAKDHLYLFNKYVLGVQEGNNKVPLAAFHKELCDFVEDGKDRKKLVLVPRMHLKSTLVTIGYSIFRIVNDPNIRILILSGTYQNAADFVGAIKDHLSRNPRLIELFGNLSKNAVEWSNNRITLSTQRTSLGDKEPTVLGTGIETNIVSKHFDLIILDDVVVRENTETMEQVEKVIKRYKDTINLMETKAQLVVIGTRWVDYDLYSWILDPENHQKHYFDIFIKKAVEWDGPIEEALGKGEGITSLLWPEKFTREELYKRFRSVGPYEFSTQYLNDPVPSTEAKFRKDWFQYFEESDVKNDVHNVYITVDPAITTKKESDYTAIVVTSIDRWGNIYFRDGIRERLTVDQIIMVTFKLAEMWHPKQIGLEDVAWQKALAYSMREEMRKRGRHLPIVPVKPQARSKEERIQGLQPQYANGKVFHNKSLSITKYLEDELLRFPYAKHDDVIDAFAYVLDFLIKPRTKYGHWKKHDFLY